ncbi:MAG: hypothetical protein ACE5K4_03865 [Candidatus Hydrothermarchaeota archaeon]
MIVSRITGRTRIIDEICGFKLEDFFKIIITMAENSYTGRIKIFSRDKDSETWMIFKEGTLIEFYTINKGLGDIDPSLVSEYPKEEPDIKDKIEITVLGPNKELNEKVDFFLDFKRENTSSRRVKILDERKIQKLIRSDVFSCN